jgi:hypothetical protein
MGILHKSAAKMRTPNASESSRKKEAIPASYMHATVKEESAHIPGGPFPQRMLRSYFEITREKFWGTKDRREAFRDALAMAQVQNPGFEFQYPREYFEQTWEKK